MEYEQGQRRMKELLKALAFCMIGMTICWVPILHINHWTMQWNGQPVKLFGATP